MQPQESLFTQLLKPFAKLTFILSLLLVLVVGGWYCFRDAIKDAWISYNIRMQRAVIAATKDLQTQPVVASPQPESRPQSVPASNTASAPEPPLSPAERFFMPILKALDAGSVPDNIRAPLAFRSRAEQARFSAAEVAVLTAVMDLDQVIRALAISRESVLQGAEELVVGRDLLHNVSPECALACAELGTQAWLPATAPYKFEPGAKILSELLGIHGLEEQRRNSPALLLELLFYEQGCGISSDQYWISPAQFHVVAMRRNVTLGADSFDVAYVEELIRWFNHTCPLVQRCSEQLARVQMLLVQSGSPVRIRVPSIVVACLEIAVPRPPQEACDITLEMGGQFADRMRRGPHDASVGQGGMSLTDYTAVLMRDMGMVNMWTAQDDCSEQWQARWAAVQAFRAAFPGKRLPALSTSAGLGGFTAERVVAAIGARNQSLREALELREGKEMKEGKEAERRK